MKKILLFLLLFCVAVTAYLSYPKITLYFNGNKTSINTESLDIFVPRNTSLSDLATLLSENNIIDDQDAFIAVGEYKALTKESIAAGKYRIAAGTSYKDLLNGFTLNAKGNGNKEIAVEVRFNNCKNISDLGRQVAKQMDISADELINEINATDFSSFDITVSKEQLPALFLPNTYKMYYDLSAKEFISKMIEEYKKFWNEQRIEKLHSIGLKEPHQASTIASIVYAEQSQVAKEWPIIAAVYLNRIQQKIPLQSCPTVRFCDSTITGQPYGEDIERNKNNPYNTYTHNGLPPGPINLPSPEVIDAVLNRTQDKYIYMCAKPDYSHTHNFATNLREHNRNSEIVNAFYRKIKNTSK